MMESKQINAALKSAAQFTKIGFGITIVYLAVLVAYSVSEWKEIGYMKPNEFGDFLAGVFGPLAFFWLVCGYLQQGVELKNNSSALLLQAQELQISSQALVAQVAEMKESVAQQKLVAEVTQGQFRAAEAARYAEEEKYKPKFQVTKTDQAVGSDRKIIWTRNSGHAVTLISDGSMSLFVHSNDSNRIESGGIFRLVLKTNIDLEGRLPKMMFRQDNGKSGELLLHLPHPDSPAHVKPNIAVLPVS